MNTSTVLKYPLKITEEQFIATREYAEPLFVAGQNYQLSLWMRVDTSLPIHQRKVLMFQDGGACPSAVSIFKYIGSVIIEGNPAYHVFIEEA